MTHPGSDTSQTVLHFASGSVIFLRLLYSSDCFFLLHLLSEVCFLLFSLLPSCCCFYYVEGCLSFLSPSLFLLVLLITTPVVLVLALALALGQALVVAALAWVCGGNLKQSISQLHAQIVSRCRTWGNPLRHVHYSCIYGILGGWYTPTLDALPSDTCYRSWNGCPRGSARS